MSGDSVFFEVSKDKVKVQLWSCKFDNVTAVAASFLYIIPGKPTQTNKVTKGLSTIHILFESSVLIHNLHYCLS